jgi:hypothetical protein
MLANYKTYACILSQTGTNNPSAIVLENNLGNEITWVRNDVGDYSGSIPGGFDRDKVIFLWSSSDGSTSFSIYVKQTGEIQIDTLMMDDSYTYKEIGFRFPLEIHVYG